MKAVKLFAAMIIAFAIAWASTRAASNYDISHVIWVYAGLLSFPGVLVAVFLGVFGILGTAHDPSIGLIEVVDFIFYTLLLYWLLVRKKKAN